MLLTPQYCILQCWWTRWRSDVNRNKEGETGRSMWNNKDKVFRTWRIESDLEPELEKQFSNQIGSCGMYNPHFSLQKTSTDQSASFIWSTVQVHLAVSHCCSFLLLPTLCPAIQPDPFRKGLFFKAGTAGYLKWSIICFSFKTENRLLYSHEHSSHRIAFPAHPCS